MLKYESQGGTTTQVESSQFFQPTCGDFAAFKLCDEISDAATPVFKPPGLPKQPFERPFIRYSH